MSNVTLDVGIGILIGLCGARYLRHLVVMRDMEKNYKKLRQYKHWRL